MPIAQTKFFGSVEYPESDVLEFPAGLPGFAALRRFLMLQPEHTAPVTFLQSLDEGQLCFLTMPVELVDPRYELALAPEDLRMLEVEDAAGPRLLAHVILTVPAEGPATANLLAPVVVAPQTRRGVQAVRSDFRYAAAVPLPEPAVAGESPCS
jgi:flagellar assembly factor FliW